MDAERQSGQADVPPPEAGRALAQQRGTLRYRAWQRLRGQRAFRRERNTGVYRHSGAALVRILPPWELDSASNRPASAGAADTVASPAADTGAGATESGLLYQPCCRLGVVASRKVGNAVARNRAKRVWREIFRLNQQLLPQGCDVLVIVRKDFANVARSELDTMFADAARRARRAFGTEKR